jgi:L-amino acid N-acyltransferase YncA
MGDEWMIIRKAVAKDAEGIAKVHVESWKTTYKNIVSDEFLNTLSYDSRKQMWENAIPNSHVFVAENEDGQIIGFSTGGKERTGKYENYKGELYAIYILKEYQAQGLGKKLVKPIIEVLENLNIYSMLVLVLEENPSRYFYESLGGEKIDSIDIEIGGEILKETVYGWSDITYLFKL